jgi:PTH1 family peptidyl-tRNA hydrolase
MAQSCPIRAIAGLGNPGTEHARTRHNAGFWLADALAETFGGTFRKETRFHGHATEITVAGQRLLVLKPATYMNKSGQAIQALMAFHKLAPDEILVAHDELDLPAGVPRLKNGGGHGGHNGLRDVHAAIGPDYRRLRIGIGHPGHKDDVLDYVLKKPSAADEKLIRGAIDAAVDALPLLVEKGWDAATNKLNAIKPASPPPHAGEG